MWVVLVPSGVEWLDAEIGGFPATGVVAALGSAGAGKTSLALGFALAALARGRTCFLTSESADSVLETSRTQLEQDLRPYIAEGRLTVLSFAPFFTNKVRSLNSVDAPFSELKEFLAERQIKHLVLDTIDPLLTWIDAASATAVVRGIMGQMQSWQVSVLCMMSGNAPAITEFARTASGSLELTEGKLAVHHAGWCNVYGIEAPLQFVQGRGFMVRGPTARGGAAQAPAPPAMQARPAPVALIGLPHRPIPAPHVYSPPEVDPTWQSLIGNEMNELSLIGAHPGLPPGQPMQPPQAQPQEQPMQLMRQQLQARMANQQQPQVQIPAPPPKKQHQPGQSGQSAHPVMPVPPKRKQ